MGKAKFLNEKLKVEQNPERPVEKPVLAEAIVTISKNVKALRESGLNEKAIVALLKDSTGLYKSDIERLLRGLDTLRHDYCR